MKFAYIISFFLFLNFMLLLIPKLMPNVVTAGQMVFWIIWTNSIFLLTMVLPHTPSDLFPFKSGVNILKAFKNIRNKKANDADEKKDMQKKETAQAKQATQATQPDAKTPASDAKSPPSDAKSPPSEAKK